MFTILAKGGTPSGQICPNNTTEFNTMSIIKTILLFCSILSFNILKLITPSQL